MFNTSSVDLSMNTTFVIYWMRIILKRIIKLGGAKLCISLDLQHLCQVKIQIMSFVRKYKNTDRQ